MLRAWVMQDILFLIGRNQEWTKSVDLQIFVLRRTSRGNLLKILRLAFHVLHPCKGSQWEHW